MKTSLRLPSSLISTIRFALAGIVLGLGTATLSHCSTTAGFGEDVQDLGEEIEDAAR